MILGYANNRRHAMQAAKPRAQKQDYLRRQDLAANASPTTSLLQPFTAANMLRQVPAV